MIAGALKLSVYFGESLTTGTAPASEVLMGCFAEHRLGTAALLRGIEGFGLNRRIHAERIPDVSTDLPLIAVAVDTRERIRAVLDDVDRVMARGLVTLEDVHLARGRPVAEADFPDGPGEAAKLTIWCASGERIGRRPAYREVVALLRRCGASGATVLPGVDGLLAGRRRRARLFSANANTPMAIVSVGALDRLGRALPRLGDVLAEPTVTLERVVQVKHDGEQLAPLPMVAHERSDVWQTLRVYTRQSAQAGGRALHSELVRCLRETGAAGATTILGDWGFSSDERPYGDRLGRIASHRPTYSVYVDRPHKVAEVWPRIDELTTEHAIVTSHLVPGYRELGAGQARSERSA